MRVRACETLCPTTSPWIRHGPTVRDRQHMIGSHHPTKVLWPITNLWFVLYMAPVGVGCGGGGGGLNAGRLSTNGIISRPFYLPMYSLSLCFLPVLPNLQKIFFFFCQLKIKENVWLYLVREIWIPCTYCAPKVLQTAHLSVQDLEKNTISQMKNQCHISVETHIPSCCWKLVLLLRVKNLLNLIPALSA